jgi:hypothetical protein
MGYYAAGGYYEAGGLFSFIGNAFKQVAKVVASPLAKAVGSFIPGAGLVQSIVGVVGDLAGGGGGGPSAQHAAAVSQPAGTPGMTAHVAANAPHLLRRRRVRSRRRRRSY